MTERIEKLLNELKTKKYRNNRRTAEFEDVCGETAKAAADNLKRAVAMETPVLINGDRMGFYRSTNCRLPGYGGNVTPDYGRIITYGFDNAAEKIKKRIAAEQEPEKIAYGEEMLGCIDAVIKYSEKYRDYAEKNNNIDLYKALLNVPHGGATSFYEACVFMKLILFFLRMELSDHITLGRFDQYMYPFYLKDKERGVSDDEIFELTEEFFISINFDSDLYPGVQQGDDGQSMVLGGFDETGKDMYNELSGMCMEAAKELCLIDPKINLRVGKNTPDWLYEYGTQLTKKGLGFPQYCNDDVVADGLVKLGYSREDALDYSVAACWEVIIPGKGADIPNLACVDLPKTVNDVIMQQLNECESFGELLERAADGIKAECDMTVKRNKDYKCVMKPFMSVFFDGCIEKLADMHHGGAKYHNFGCFGVGISNAADALAAVKKTVYDEKSITKEELLTALRNNFEGNAALRKKLIDCPKMGNNDDYADDMAGFIMQVFSENINNRDNGCGGIWRAGTGSAQTYIRYGTVCPATADGRLAGTPYASSFSPSLDIKTDGLLSVIQSFSKFDMKNIINGGPLTIEIHDTVLRNDIGIKKTAMLVKEYIMLGGHQLQINSVNREELLDAQKNPEKHKNLIVRVWGWSGYFNELDKEYQDHVIRRTEYNL